MVQQYALDAIGDTRKVYKDPLPAAAADLQLARSTCRMLVQQAVFTVHASDKAAGPD